MNHTAGRSPTVRRTLFLTGAVLWLLVILVVAMLWTKRGDRDNASRPPAPEPLVVEPEEHAPASDSPDKPFWDPQGVADFSLTERSGRTVTKADLLGHPWAVCFIFTQCAGPCPRVSAQMKQLQDHLAETDVRFVSITVDPKNDTIDTLRKYADAFGADPERWLYLTGDQEAIYRLIGGSFKMPVFEVQGEDRKPGFQVIHSTNILHVNRQGVVVGKYDARKDTAMAQLRRALEEEAAGSASPADGEPPQQEPDAPTPDTGPSGG